MDRKYPHGVSIWVKSIHIVRFEAFFSKQNGIAVLLYTAQKTYIFHSLESTKYYEQMLETKPGILEIATVLHEKWVILELIGRGGMGEVYRAHQLNLKKKKIDRSQQSRDFALNLKRLSREENLKAFLRSNHQVDHEPSWLTMNGFGEKLSIPLGSIF